MYTSYLYKLLLVALIASLSSSLRQSVEFDSTILVLLVLFFIYYFF